MGTVEWPIRGRDAELAAIQGAIDDPAKHGVMLVGPQGVGRTRLAREAGHRLALAGRPWAWATGSRSASTVPFGALASLLPDEHASLPLDRPAELLRQAAAIVRHLGRNTECRAPVRPAIVVDDAHLLDDLSAAFLHQVAVHELGDLILTARREGRPPDAVTALWKDDHVDRLDLGPLDRSTTADLLESVLGGRLDPLSLRRLWQTTRGNPLFLREVVRAALADGSLGRRRGLWQWDGVLAANERLVDLVESRLAAEDPRCTGVLELIACGEPLPLWLAERVAGTTDVELTERAGFLSRVLDGDETALRFSHPAYREVLRATMPASRWRTACDQLATTLLEHGSLHAASLVRAAVWQLEAGVPVDRRGVSFAAAARHALLDDDPHLAERLARAALGPEPTGALAALAESLEKQGRHDEVVKLLQDLPTNDPTALTLAWASNLYWADDTWRDEARDPVAAAPSVDGTDPSGGEVSATEAWILFFESSLPECIELARQVLDRPDATLRAKTWAATVGAAALALRGRPGEALILADLGVKAAETLGTTHLWGQPEVRWARVLALVTAGRLAEARHIVDTSPDPPDGSAQLVGMGLGFRGMVTRLQGDHAAALRSLREAVVLMDRADMYRFVRLWLAELAAALAATGDAGGAREAFDEARSRDTGTNRVFDPWITLAGAWVCAAEGRLGDAVAAAVEAAGAARDLGQWGFEVVAAFDVARLGRPELVEERLRALSAIVDGDLARVGRDATIALTTRDPAGLVDCSRRFEVLGHDLVASESATAAQALLRAAGDPVLAAHAAERARRLRTRCPHAATPLLGFRSDHLALTHREREIADLAAAGRSSPDIARLLHISPRTVDNHLGRTYTKLGLAGRAELRAVLGMPPRPPGAAPG